MRRTILILLLLLFIKIHAATLYPGLTTDISFEPTTGEYGPTWTTDNPTLHLSSVGFLCHVTAQAYFGGSATVTCTYKDRIGMSTYTRTRNWTFTCADTKITVSPTSKTIKEGDSFQLSWSFSNTIYITPSIQFTGFDYNIISVSNTGLVTAQKEGATEIFVKSNIGTNSAICSVRVNSDGSKSSTSSYDEWDSTNTTLINLEHPGTLSDCIPESQKYSITNLTIVGPLNGTDLRFLRDMCGVDENRKSTNGKLKIIDLKDAVFVEGGSWYVKSNQNYLYTEDSRLMPEYSFAWLPKLEKIRFPKYCMELTNGSLLQCQSLEYMAIPPGVITLDRLSLDGGYEDMPMSVLSLPSSLESFNADIYNCANLTDVYCFATEPPSVLSPWNFSNSNTNFKNGTLYVPKGSAKKYWQAKGWRDFKDIKETLDVYKTLTIWTSPHGTIKYNDVEIRQNYDVWYAGLQAFEAPLGEDVFIEITPDEGYAVSKILIDEECPCDIPKDGILKLNKLQQPTKVSFYFEESASIDDIFIDLSSTLLDVYNLQGVILRENISREEIVNLPRGIYIIKTDNRSYKYLQR